ncbi:MAG: Hint domain-containing protein [Paracoccaceae bacterium]
MFMKDFTRTAHSVIAAEMVVQPVTSGILAGTLVETAKGWQAVETLRMGDLVQSFDGGLVKVLGLDRRTLRPEMGQALITVPGGAFDACSDLQLLPGQHVLVDTFGDACLPDDAFALIPAVSLVGHHGCTRRYTLRDIEVVTPMFAEEEVIWANSGLLIHCPGIATGAGRRPASDFFTRLDVTGAHGLLARRAALLAA